MAVPAFGGEPAQTELRPTKPGGSKLLINLVS